MIEPNTKPNDLEFNVRESTEADKRCSLCAKQEKLLCKPLTTHFGRSIYVQPQFVCNVFEVIG